MATTNRSSYPRAAKIQGNPATSETCETMIRRNNQKDIDNEKLISYFAQKPLNEEGFSKLYTYLLDHPTLWDYIKHVITRYRMTRRYKRSIRNLEPLNHEDISSGDPVDPSK